MSADTAQAGIFSRRMLAVAAVAAIALSVALLARPVLATHVVPTLVEGNHTCAQLDEEFGHEFKIEPVLSGVYDDPASDFSVEITVNDTPAGPTLDFESNIGVDAAFVKGGDDGNLYSYAPPEKADTGLHAPLNPSGKWAGLSHVSFCFNETPEESVPPSAEGSVAASVAASVPPSAEGSVKAGTGTPAASTSNTALFGDGSNPLPTVVFSLILLASLGALAYANVKTVRSRI